MAHGRAERVTGAACTTRMYLIGVLWIAQRGLALILAISIARRPLVICFERRHFQHMGERPETFGPCQRGEANCNLSDVIDGVSRCHHGGYSPLCKASRASRLRAENHSGVLMPPVRRMEADHPKV